jgi:hypothetical protein
LGRFTSHRLVTAAAAVLAAGGGCAASTGRTAAVDARGFYYLDNSGVSVATLGASVAQPVDPRTVVSARAAGERIKLERKPLPPGDPNHSHETGHPPHDPDAVSSASSTAGGGSVKEELRFEGLVGARRALDWAGRPAGARMLVRGSTEPDYRSLYVGAGGDLELGRRATAVTAFVGVGRDRVLPVEAPPGQDDDWPATHWRVNGLASVSQAVHPRVLLAAAAAFTVQRGQLSSPYRRALVLTTLFPENHPSARDRVTGYVGGIVYLGWETALHLRAGAYADSWEVMALVPEATLATSPWPSLLLTARYHLYLQSRAYFFDSVYPRVETIMTGDVRLGPILEHGVGLSARWTVRGQRGEPGALTLSGGWSFAATDYRDYGTALILAETFHLGLTGEY